MVSNIKKILQAPDLPGHDFIFALADCASTLLETEITDFRQAAENGKPGSLLDFKKSPLPLIVVPDIHARPLFLENILKILNSHSPGLIQSGQVQVQNRQLQ